MHFDLFTIINIIGVVAFAFAGAMKAIREAMDILGVVVLGVITALGGGLIRDVIINKIPYALSSPFDLTAATFGVLAAGLVFKFMNKDFSTSYYILIPDALGLATFTSTGALVAYHSGICGSGLIILATTTAVGGGVVGDLLLGKVPSVLKHDCYATCSIAGGICFCLALLLGADLLKCSLICSGITMTIRVMAIYGKWNLPRLT